MKMEKKLNENQKVQYTSGQLLQRDEAMEAAMAGEYLRLVDDGRGFKLAGVITAFPIEMLINAVRFSIVGELAIEGAQLCLINIVQSSDDSVVVRTYNIHDFKEESMFKVVKVEDLDLPLHDVNERMSELRRLAHVQKEVEPMSGMHVIRPTDDEDLPN